MTLTLLKFWAPWCGPCKMLAPTVDAFIDQYPGVELKAINVDEDPVTASTYQVMSLPTVILTKDGQEIDRHVGNASRDQFFQKFAGAIRAA